MELRLEREKSKNELKSNTFSSTQRSKNTQFNTL